MNEKLEELSVEFNKENVNLSMGQVCELCELRGERIKELEEKIEKLELDVKVLESYIKGLKDGLKDKVN